MLEAKMHAYACLVSSNLSVYYTIDKFESLDAMTSSVDHKP